jgi:hypothetical protein
MVAGALALLQLAAQVLQSVRSNFRAAEPCYLVERSIVFVQPCHQYPQYEAGEAVVAWCQHQKCRDGVQLTAVLPVEVVAPVLLFAPLCYPSYPLYLLL